MFILTALTLTYNTYKRAASFPKIRISDVTINILIKAPREKQNI